jgi:methylthioribose-1-phosphate isomerase
MVIVGADRVSLSGDAANKIGTYLKALAAKDNQIPFFVAFPSSTFDFEIIDGVGEIPIEERTSEEVRKVSGKDKNGVICDVQICPDSTPAKNWGFDVTPARLITKLITERGVFEPKQETILKIH